MSPDPGGPFTSPASEAVAPTSTIAEIATVVASIFLICLPPHVRRLLTHLTVIMSKPDCRLNDRSID
jgi:hypothetical protein